MWSEHLGGWDSSFFFLLLMVPMVPIARMRRPFQFLALIGVGYLRSFAWRFGGYKCDRQVVPACIVGRLPPGSSSWTID